VPIDRWTSGDIAANGTTLHWTRTGGDLPQVLLAHGLTDDGLCWTPVADELEGDYDLVMVDARGHGRSAAPASGYEPLTMGADLMAASDALGLRRPVLVGHSMGAVASLLAAGLRPDVVRALFLEDPPGMWTMSRPENADEIAMGLRRQIEANAVMPADDLAAIGRAENPRWSDAEISAWVAAQKSVKPAVTAFFDGDDLARIPWSELLGAVTCPVHLALADTAAGSLLDDDALTALRRFIPRLRAKRFPSAGHSVRREAFVPYMESLREFLHANAG
jgi:pimeloyl-ACP methyl ester carboxylesterase